MINEGKNNSILVSGESGAGKTEATKVILGHISKATAAGQFDGGNRKNKITNSKRDN